MWYCSRASSRSSSESSSNSERAGLCAYPMRGETGLRAAGFGVFASMAFPQGLAGIGAGSISQATCRVPRWNQSSEAVIAKEIQLSGDDHIRARRSQLCDSSQRNREPAVDLVADIGVCEIYQAIAAR